MSYNLQYIFIHLLENMHHFHSTTIRGGEGGTTHDTTQSKQTKYNLKQNPLKALLK